VKWRSIPTAVLLGAVAAGLLPQQLAVAFATAWCCPLLLLLLLVG
jgi:hypothetical protein